MTTLYEVTDLRNGEERKAWVNPLRITYARPTAIIKQLAATYEEAEAKGIKPLKMVDAVWVGFTHNDGVIISPEEFDVLKLAAGIVVMRCSHD